MPKKKPTTRPPKPELAPCPFCGSKHVSLGWYVVDPGISGEARHRTPKDIKGAKVECLECAVLIMSPCDTDDEADRELSRDIVAEKWNRRVSGIGREMADKERKVRVKEQREAMRRDGQAEVRRQAFHIMHESAQDAPGDD